MLSVSVDLTPEGCLERLEARGHARGGPIGANLACAAATALLRTAAEVLMTESRVRCSGSAPREGELTLVVDAVEPGAEAWARGVADVVVRGCRRLQGESGGELRVTVHRRGMNDGA